MNDVAIRVALVGYGFSARTFHLPFLDSDARYRVEAISSSREAEVKSERPDVAWFGEAEAMIAGCNADLVVITAPNAVHYPLARLALETGRHVVLEKPFVTRSEQGEALVALADRNNRVLSVYHNRRWDGDFLTIQKLLEEKRLGAIRYFESHFDRFRPEVRQRWRESPVEGGGILFDLGPHLIDQALQLFGMPEAITARCLRLRPGAEVDDFFHLQLHYPDKLAVLHSSPFCAAPNLRFQLQGELGSYVKYGLDPQEERLKAGAAPTPTQWAREAREAWGLFYDLDGAQPVATETGGYQYFYHSLARAVLAGEPPPVSAAEALATIRVIESAFASAASGRTVAIDPQR